MKEISKRIISILVVMLLVVNSSLLTVISTAIDAIEEAIDMEKIKPSVEINMEKFLNYELDGEKGLLVKINVNTGTEYDEGQEAKELKSTTIGLIMPQINGEYPENIELQETSTKINNFIYNNQTGQITVYIDNEENKNNESNFAIDIYYSSNCYEENVTSKNLEFYGAIIEKIANSEETQISDTFTNSFEIEKNISGLISTEVLTSDIYNGYINSNAQNGTQYQTEFTENLAINIDYKEISEEIEIKENDKFIDAENQEVETNDIIYKSVSLNKNNILDVLGENGTLVIQNELGNDLLKINKDTSSEEDGTIKMNFSNEVKGLIIKTSTPEKVGIIRIESKKAIKGTMIDLSCNAIKTEFEINCKNNIVERNQETNEIINEETQTIYTFNDYKEIQIKNKETRVGLSIDKKSLITNASNEVNFTATLVSNDAKYSLFKNPVIEIKLPAEVEDVSLGTVFILYDNNFSVVDSDVTEEEGCKVIRITLNGAQNSYVSSDVFAGPELFIPATLTVNRNVASNENAIVNIKCINRNGEQEQFNKDYNITINSIQVMTFSDEESEEQGETGEQGEQEEIIEDYTGLSSQITATLGEKILAEGEEVYEYEYIKYNITLKNNTNSQMKNIKVVGTVPEGTVYVNAYFDENRIIDNYVIEEDYEKLEFNETISLNAGEEKQISYCVKVLDLEEDLTEKNIQSNIQIYAGVNKVNEYTLNNIVKKAEIELKLQSWETRREDNLWVYKITASNKTENDISNVIIDMGLQKEMTFSYIDFDDGSYTVNETVDGLRVNVPELKANEEQEIWLFIQMARTDESILDFEIQTYASAKGDNTKTYYSNINKAQVYTAGIQVVQTSAKEGKELQYDEEVEYNFVIRNISNEKILKDMLTLDLMNFADENLVPASADYEYWDYEYNEENDTYELVKKTKTVDISRKAVPDGIDESTVADLYVTLAIPVKEEINLTLKLKAGEVKEKTETTNCLKIAYEYCGEHIVTSNIIKNTILPREIPEEEPDESEENTNKYSISGFAWKDADKNGKFDQEEERLSGITVKLFNAETNSIVKDENGNNLYTTTDKNGEYVFENVSVGKYLVLFEYDVDNYTLTTYKKDLVSDTSNSDVVVKNVSIDGVEKTVAVTDILEVKDENKGYINIGLIEREKFDLALDKSITKVTVKYPGFYKEYEYNETKLAKVDIPAKNLSDAEVQVDYQIKVTNEGNAKGYVNEIVDYLPDGFEFDNEVNEGWVYQDGMIKNTSNSGIIINPGESKIFIVHLAKLLDENSTGRYENSAEIINSSSVNGNIDIDSTNGNKVDTEDDYSKAELLISIKTGAAMYMGILTLLIGILVIVKILLNKNIINIKKLKIFSIVFVLMFLIVGCNSSKAATAVAGKAEAATYDTITSAEKKAYIKENYEPIDTTPRVLYMEHRTGLTETQFINITKNIPDSYLWSANETITVNYYKHKKADGTYISDSNGIIYTEESYPSNVYHEINGEYCELCVFTKVPTKYYEIKIAHNYTHHGNEKISGVLYCQDGRSYGCKS